MRRRATAVPLHTVDPEMFWSCVEIAGDRDCWPWVAARSDKGYGTLYVLGKTCGAHRIAWALYHGRTPAEPMPIVRHTCDNPPCCNPAHLAEGTIADNNRDIVERHRRRGYNALVIARAMVDGATADDLVSIFAMHPDTAREYIRLGPEGAVARAAERGLPKKREPKTDRRKYVHNPEALEAARKGASLAQLMKDFSISKATAYRYLARARAA